MNFIVPKSFLEQALEYGLNKELAEEVFTYKISKQNVDKLALKLVRLNVAETESRARFLIRSLWRDYNDNNEDLLSSMYNYQMREVVDEKESYLQKAKSGLESIIGTLNTPKIPNRKKIHRHIVCSDLHIPFQDNELLAQVLSEEADDLYFLGDLLDLFSLSKYRQTIDYINTRDELAQGRAVLEAFSEKFNNVYILEGGNHDSRALKKVQDIAPQLLPLIVPPVKLISSGLNNIHPLSTVVENTAPNVMFGKNVEMSYVAYKNGMILSHMENFCTDQGVKDIDKWVSEWSHYLKFPEPKAILHSHTHSLSLSYTSKGKILINTGCLCKAMPYVFDNHGKYRPPVRRLYCNLH